MSDARWGNPREYDTREPGDEWPRVYVPRERDDQDPRDGLMRDLDLPRGDERELVVDGDRVYELDGEDSRALAAVGAFRVVPEHDLNLPHDTLENRHDQRLVELVDLDDGERGLTLNVTFRSLPPEEFAAFREPGYVKIAWTLRADSVGAAAAIFRTETRVITTDPASRARFRCYWSFFSAGILLIRWMSLARLKRDAERRASTSDDAARC